jgi:hypothetical protein
MPEKPPFLLIQGSHLPEIPLDDLFDALDHLYEVDWALVADPRTGQAFMVIVPRETPPAARAG